MRLRWLLSMFILYFILVAVAVKVANQLGLTLLR